MEKIVKKIRINTTIELLTGLHIGGSSENVEIGGIDNSVIKIATKDSQPYIPGSSLKGKMRCLLEQVAGAAKVGGNDAINNMFGFQITNQPSKIIVRDAYLTEESEKQLRACDNLDMPYTECKYENTIDRLTGTTIKGGIRQSERVPAGAKFAVEFVINVWDDDKEQQLMDMLRKGIRLIENDYLGGSGSRGYGQVKFDDLQISELSEKNNWQA